MEFIIICLMAMAILTLVFDVEEPLFSSLVIAAIISGSGDSDSEEEIDTTKGKPKIITEKKINSAPQENIVKEIPENDTRIEWENNDTKWNYHEGQIWETQKNF